MRISSFIRPGGLRSNAEWSGRFYERWGRFGLGSNHDEDIPEIGAVHLASGYLVSEMLGCRVEYVEDAAPRVVPANLDRLRLAPQAALESPASKKLQTLLDALRTKYGYVRGDVNWSGILNVALDLRGQTIFMDMLDEPDAASQFLAEIGEVLEGFTARMAAATGTTSISVNRNVGNIPRPVFLHSECSHVMISVADYERFLMPMDAAWSHRHRPFGIHYCGADPQRYAEAFPRGFRTWIFSMSDGRADVAQLRRHLPQTFLNIRYSPVEIARQTPDEIRRTVRRLVHDSGNPWLTGVCCINMDQQVSDAQITAIFEEVESLRQSEAV